MRPRSRRRTRLDLVALLVTVVCVAVAGWALRGLLTDPVRDVEDFGADTAAVTMDAGVDEQADSRGVPPAREDPTTATEEPRRTGAVPTPPARRSAALADQPAPAPAPVGLRVPAVDLEVPLDAVGVEPDGQMVVPDDADRAGWYRYGPAPGAGQGSAVIAGHVDDRSGPGAFLALTEARKGDEIVVTLEDGTSTTYRVVSRVTVAKPELAVDDLFRRDGPPALHLVTCAGEWSRATGRYTDNLVVTAEPVQG